MILRESRRFFSSNRLLSLTGVLLLGVGFGSAAVARCLLLSFSMPNFPGMRSQPYATIGAGLEQGVAMPVSWERYQDLVRENNGGIRLAAYSPANDVTLMSRSQQKPIKVAMLSGRFFSEFGVALAAGRDFYLSDAETPGRHVLILGYALARELFGSPQAALGQSVLLNGSAYEVVGVAASSFHGIFGDSADGWTPASCVVPFILTLPANDEEPSNLWKYLNAFYVLATSGANSSEPLAATVGRYLPLRSSSGSSLSVAEGITIDWGRNERLQRWLRLGLGFALALAVVSYLNVCLLLLARAPLLVDEVQLKRALGGSSRQIALELTAGPATMMTVGLLGAGALCAISLLAVARSSDLNRQILAGSVGVVIPALAEQMFFAFAIALLVALAPAVLSLRSGNAPRLGSAATAGRGILVLMQIPVVAQISCGILVSILAGMIGSSLLALMKQPLGYDPSHRFVICLTPSGGTIVFRGTTGASAQFLSLNNVLRQIRSMPGIHSASYVDAAPFDGSNAVDAIQARGQTQAHLLTAAHKLVTAGYFRTVGTRILRGSDVSDWIRTGAAHEVVLSNTLSIALFQRQNPVGKTVEVIVPARFGLRISTYPAIVVGVAEDIRDAGYASSPQLTFYEEGHAASDARPHIVVDGDETPHALEEWSKQAVSEWMPGMGVEKVYSLQEQTQASLIPDRNRVMGALLGSFVMALVALVGLYSTLAFYLRSKRREMAVRMCLGASRWTIRKMVLVRALRCALAASLLSLPMWFLLRRLSGNEYVGQVAWSWLSAATITLLCVAGSVVLAWFPASAVMSISPAGLLKEQ